MDNDMMQLRTAQEQLLAAKEAFRRSYRDLSGDQLELAWNRFCSSPGAGVGHPPDLPRTMSWTGYLEGSGLSSLDDTQPLEMTRSGGLSIQSAPETLSRSPSHAFGHGMYSTMSTSSSRYPTPSAYRTETDGNYTASPATRASRKRHRHQLPKVTEYDPSVYVATISEDTGLTTTNPAFLAHGLPANGYPDRSRLSVTTAPMLDRSYSFDSSSTPSTPAITEASTLSSQEMSRNGSIVSTHSPVNNSLCEAVDMIRFNSSHSNFSFARGDINAPFDVSADFCEDDLGACTQSYQSDQKYLVAHDQDLSPTSTFTFSSSNANSASFSSQLLTPSDATLIMNNSWSSQSSESDSSTSQSRSSRRQNLKEQIQRGNNCPIAPKVDTSRKPAPMVRVASSDGSVQVKALISRKAPYQRPQHPKLFCPYCNDHPDGFRGEHELQRHTNRAHPSGIRKVWICEDLFGDGQFLANCKACRTKKRYGAYYNAAAHLRRAHFNPRKRGRKAKTDAEKRGGKGGGNWPAMELLKERWMREVEEVVDDSSPPVDYSNAATADVEDELVSPELSTSLTDQPSISPDSDYDNLWQDSAFQFTADGLTDPAYDMGIDVASESCFSYDVQASQPAFASPDVELFQIEESLRWN